MKHLRFHILVVLMLLPCLAEASLKISVKDYDTKEVKFFKTNESFSIPVSTATQMCEVRLLEKNRWIVQCSRHDKKSDYMLPTPQIFLSCGYANNNVSFDMFRDEIDKGLWKPKFGFSIICER